MDRPEAIADVCQRLIDRLVAEGLARPSIYLARGERLRIQAVAGYHQIFDGLPAGVGVIGRAYARGLTIVVDDVTEDGGYLAANPGVACELCVPIRAGGRVVGILNIESDQRFERGIVDRMEAEAAALGAEIERLGHDVAESPAQRLVRHALRLGALTVPADVHAAAVDAARDLAGTGSAALVLTEAGRLHVAAAEGSLAPAILDLPLRELQGVAALVRSGCSTYTVGGTIDTGDEVCVLRNRGAEAVITIPMPTTDGRRGLLLIADERPLVPGTDTVELLEALAAHVASCLRTCSALAELRERAASDPLTGLGHHATFHAALADARGRGEEIAVLLVDLDGFKEVNDSRGHQAGDRVLRVTAAALSSTLRRGDELFRIGGDEFAAIVRVGHASDAVEAGRRLRDAVAGLGSITVSVGAALPRPGEPDTALLARADEALYRVKEEGRDGVALLS